MKLGPDVKPGEALAEILDRKIIDKNWHSFERVQFRTRKFDGEWSPTTERTIIKPGPCGKVVAVLPYDPVRDVFVFNEEFRIGGFEIGANPYMLEISAGHMEADENPQEAAARELKEEIGLTAKRLEFVYDYMPSAGISTELITAYIGEVDSTEATQHGGLANETEFIRAHVMPVAEAFAMMEANQILNVSALLMLNWFARQHTTLRQRWLDNPV